MEIVIIEASPELSRLSQKIFKRNSSRDKEISHSAIKAILVPKMGIPLTEVEHNTTLQITIITIN